MAKPAKSEKPAAAKASKAAGAVKKPKVSEAAAPAVMAAAPSAPAAAVPSAAEMRRIAHMAAWNRMNGRNDAANPFAGRSGRKGGKE